MKYIESIFSFLIALAKIFFRPGEKCKPSDCPCPLNDQDKKEEPSATDPDPE